MMNFPTATTVRKRLPKEAFYRHLALTNALKEKFVSDVDRIMVENSFTKQTLNLTASAETKEILLLSVRLKNAGVRRQGHRGDRPAEQAPARLLAVL